MLRIDVHAKFDSSLVPIKHRIIISQENAAEKIRATLLHFVLFYSFHGDRLLRLLKLLHRLRKLHKAENTIVFLDEGVGLWHQFENAVGVEHNLYWLHSLCVICAFLALLLLFIKLSKTNDLIAADLAAELLFPESHDILIMLWRNSKQ